MKFILLCVIALLSTNLFAEEKFSNESEVSVIQTGGNSVVETYNAKTISKWEKGKRVYSLGGHYTLGASEQDDANGDSEKITSARNWDANMKYEQVLSTSLSGFVGVIYEGDEFSGLKKRENFDLGAKHFFTKTDKLKSFAELGARYSIEHTTVRDEDGEDVFNYTKARVYYEIDHKRTETFSYKFWAEYIPNFTESDDYLLKVEPSIAFVLNSTFSFKTAYKVVYDNVPNVKGNEYTDTTLSTSLIAKF